MAHDVGTVVFSQGGTSRFSDPFIINVGDKPLAVVAHGVGVGFVTAELVRVTSTELGEEYSCNSPYPKITELDVISSMPYPCFKICSAMPVGFLTVPGWYRLVLSEDVPLEEIVVTVSDVEWMAVTSFDRSCATC